MSANISHSIRFAKGLFVKISTSHGLTAGYADDLFERILDDHPFWVSCLSFGSFPVHERLRDLECLRLEANTFLNH